MGTSVRVPYPAVRVLRGEHSIPQSNDSSRARDSRARERERERIKAGALVSYKAPLHDKYPLECRTLYFAVNVALEQ